MPLGHPVIPPALNLDPSPPLQPALIWVLPALSSLIHRQKPAVKREHFTGGSSGTEVQTAMLQLTQRLASVALSCSPCSHCSILDLGRTVRCHGYQVCFVLGILLGAPPWPVR